MGTQLIFVVETNKKCKSDWIYIKDAIDRFYAYDKAHTKLSTVYMNGKRNYEIREKDVKTLVKQYSKSADHNNSIVLYCFDCDEYDTRPEDAEFLKCARIFCEKRGYEFVWFCKDIERVFIGHKIPDSKKNKEAASFKTKKMINAVNEASLVVSDFRKNSSNLLSILDRFIPPLLRR